MIIEPKTWKRKDDASPKPRFRGLVRYMLKGKGTERCTWYMAGNLGGLDRREDSEHAIRVVEAYQRRNTRVKKPKTYHMVISLHPDDRSLRDYELAEVVRRAVAAAGLAEHQFIAARHSDQEHEHVHVAVNKIHPRTFKIHHPWKDIENFKALASELENELGLHRVDRSPLRTAQSYRSRQYESARGTESFSRWARRRIGSTIQLERHSSWNALHEELGCFGVRLVRRGNGLAIVDATRPNLACKASSLGRAWSKQRLCARLGDFAQGPTEKEVGAMTKEAYRPEALGQGREDGLWREYQEALEAARTRRAQHREALASKVAKARAAHRRRFKARHHLIAAMPISGRDKRSLYKMLSLERKVAKRSLESKIKRWRRVSIAGHPGSWKHFLSERAARGDHRAIRRLQRVSRRPAIQSDERSPRALPSRSSRTSRGTIVHNLPGGVRLLESAGAIELLGEARDDALEQLLAVARERLGTKRITLRGSQQAQRRLAELAAERGFQVTRERER